MLQRRCDGCEDSLEFVKSRTQLVDAHLIEVQSIHHAHTQTHARMIVCDYVKQLVSVSLQGRLPYARVQMSKAEQKSPPSRPRTLVRRSHRPALDV